MMYTLFENLFMIFVKQEENLDELDERLRLGSKGLTKLLKRIMGDVCRQCRYVMNKKCYHYLWGKKYSNNESKKK